MSALTETITIENVVASTDIGQELALETLAMDLTGSDYDPENFPGLVYRMQDPKAATLIFRSGKIVCTGADSVAYVHTALDVDETGRSKREGKAETVPYAVRRYYGLENSGSGFYSDPLESDGLGLLSSSSDDSRAHRHPQKLNAVHG